jgi:hypothetical protein
MARLSVARRQHRQPADRRAILFVRLTIGPAGPDALYWGLEHKNDVGTRLVEGVERLAADTALGVHLSRAVWGFPR